MPAADLLGVLLRDRRRVRLVHAHNVDVATLESMTVADNPTHNRFELRDDDRVVGWIDYRPAGGSVIVLHTEIADGNERRGLGSVLVRGMLDQVEASGKTVIPMCPFTAAYIRRHPEYARVVDSTLRDQFS